MGAEEDVMKRTANTGDLGMKEKATGIGEIVNITKDENGKVGLQYIGPRITKVVAGGPACLAGLEEGDILQSIGDIDGPFADTSCVRNAFAAAPTEFSVTLVTRSAEHRPAS